MSGALGLLFIADLKPGARDLLSDRAARWGVVVAVTLLVAGFILVTIGCWTPNDAVLWVGLGAMFGAWALVSTGIVLLLL